MAGQQRLADTYTDSDLVSLKKMAGLAVLFFSQLDKEEAALNYEYEATVLEFLKTMNINLHDFAQ